MSASEDPTDAALCPPEPRWSRWRWPLVIPAFLAGWTLSKWAPLIGARTGYGEEVPIWTGFVLTGFIPVYLAGKIAPSRQLPLAMECALLVAAYAIATATLDILFWRDSTYPWVVLALRLGYDLATLAGAASAVWLVKRRRAADPERGSTWARATGMILPVVLFANFIAVGPFP